MTSDALIFTGTPSELADLMLDWQSAGLTGFRLRPGAIPHDLRQTTRGLVPELQRRGAFRNNYESSTLRGLLGLSRPVNRYATA
jgi:alkanesulfonate monooxygenase SsuD/methylene tetrahydromethanopterin reductase-like flavin-dependent oxidoreductase (luciferase family)